MKKIFLGLFLVSCSLVCSFASLAKSDEDYESSEDDEEAINYHSLALLIRTLSQPLNFEERIEHYRLIIAAHRSNDRPAILQDR